jgi:hypothetical protein
MKMALFAGAIALALSCLLPGVVGQARASEYATGETGSLTQVNVTRIRTALKLTPAQQPYWPPIEAALRDIAREQQEPEGIIRRIGHRVVAVVLNSAAAARLAAAARPLIHMLNDEQRQIATSLAQEMGLGPMLAAL